MESPDVAASAAFHTKTASLLLFVLQAALLGGFAVAEYGSFDPDIYQIYIGVALMMLVGFGYLMAFLKMYGLGAVGFTFVLTALTVQLNTLIAPAIATNPSRPVLSANTLMDGNFGAATILISFGCIIGKASPTQLIIMSIIESVFFQINRNLICFEQLGIEDAGGSIVIHMFGAYYGLSVAMVLGKPNDVKGLEANSIISDLLSLVGTVFLWLYWPSFNGAGFVKDSAYANRCVVNTVVSLCASCVTSFAVSGVLSKRFSPADVQNATLAGGVIVGAVARMEVLPVSAAGLGAIGGAVSVFGYQRVQPMLLRKIGLHDSCGVHNLHGMPSILGGLASVIACVAVKNPTYLTNDTGTQAGYQMAAIGATLGIAIVSGVLTGLFLKCIDKQMLNIMAGGELVPHYTDAIYWQVGDKILSVDLSVHGATKHQPKIAPAPVQASPPPSAPSTLTISAAEEDAWSVTDLDR